MKKSLNNGKLLCLFINLTLLLRKNKYFTLIRNTGGPGGVTLFIIRNITPTKQLTDAGIKVHREVTQ